MKDLVRVFLDVLDYVVKLEEVIVGGDRKSVAELAISCVANLSTSRNSC
jgi:hypothetical protein